MNTLEERINKFKSAGLYFVTSENMSKGRTTLEVVNSVLDAGVKLIQLREKDKTILEYSLLAEKVRDLTDRYNALLIINDRIDVAMGVGADGVHLGQDDLPIRLAAKIAPDMIIGSSAHNLEEALAAERAGATYVNIGPIFPTNTKVWNNKYLGLEVIEEISSKISIPFTVMGGIKKHHISELIAVGANTIALVTAITAAKYPNQAAKELLSLFS